MHFTVFNVAHGFCALLVADNGNVALFDSGHDDAMGFRPSRTLAQLGVTGIEHFVLSHYDEDHVSDLPGLRALGWQMPIQTLHTNPRVTPDQVRAIKRRDGPIEPGVQTALEMTEEYVHPIGARNAQTWALEGLDIQMFYNPYPVFQDTNNLSLVTFIHHDQVSIVIPGDLERAGWMMLLENPNFIENLEQVDIFVASHHGRENGYLEEIFNHCWPAIVIISDTIIHFDTQEHNYANHALGVLCDGGPESRYVLTTRNDGNITAFTNDRGGFTINAREPQVLQGGTMRYSFT
jgi:beta-lactamase superfamily II metal-dependent hydrolase